MSQIRLGYGSEWHMLRMLGRHRRWFTERVLQETRGSSLLWLDFKFTAAATADRNYGDAELKGLNFLPPGAVRDKWSLWWPQTGGVPNWDAVGIHQINGVDEWLLVEAKANTQELFSSTSAKSVTEGGGLEQIRSCLEETQEHIGIAPLCDWTQPYYQCANRLAVLHFLTQNDVPTRLLFVYFTGDNTAGVICPQSASDWNESLEKMKAKLGLCGQSEIEKRVHRIFVPVIA